MLSDELLAAIAECDRDDAPAHLAKLRERIGGDALRDVFFEMIAEGGPQGEERPRFLQVGKFLRAVGAPPPMLIDRLVPEKSLVLLTGKPKLGKSFLGLDIADAVCQGLPVCGEFAVSRSGPVLYLGMEDGKYEIANRLLGRGIKLQDDTRPFMVCSDRFTITTLEGMALLREMVAEAKKEAGADPVLLIIDTARESLGIREWNDQAEVSDKVRPLREFAREYFSVLLIAHNRKAEGIDPGDEIAGSGAFASSVDGWISDRRVEKLEGGNRRHYLSVNGRGNMAGEYVVEMDTHTYHFRHISDEDVEEERRQRSEASRMKRYQGVAEALQQRLGNSGTVAQIAEEMGLDYKTAQNLVREMSEAGLLEDTGDAQVKGRGRPAPYYRVCKADLWNYTSIPIDRNNNSINNPAQRNGEGRI